MNFLTYCKGKLPLVLLQLAAVGFMAMLLKAIGTNWYVIFFLSGVFLLAVVAFLLFDFTRRAAFYNDLAANLKKLDKKYLLSEMLERPSFREGQLLFDAIKASNKSMSDEVAHYRRASAEYREYIETWVHEVKTPIASSKLIMENHKSPVTATLLEEMDKIEGFVEQALYYARSGSVEKDYSIKQLSLKALINTAVRKCARPIIDHKMTVDIQSVDCTVYTDEKWILFILSQILQNAVKYRKPDSSETPRLTFRAEESESSVILLIADNGIGISARDVSRVFDKGFTGENGRRYSRSTGIGLYLCKLLCDKLGLRLALESREGEGTTVRIRFPKSRMHLLEQ